MRLTPPDNFYFTVTAWELASLRHLHRAVEENIEDVLERYGVDDGRGNLVADLSLLMVEPRVKPLFRIPVLTSAWSLYEACLIDTAHFFATRVGLPYSVDSHPDHVAAPLQKRWRKWDVIRRAKHFFERELDVQLNPTAEDERSLHALRELRNVLAHTGGRCSVSRQKDWSRLARIASGAIGLDISTGFVVPSREFVNAQLDLVDRCSAFFVRGAQRVLVERNLLTRT